MNDSTLQNARKNLHDINLIFYPFLQEEKDKKEIAFDITLQQQLEKILVRLTCVICALVLYIINAITCCAKIFCLTSLMNMKRLWHGQERRK